MFSNPLSMSNLAKCPFCHNNIHMKDETLSAHKHQNGECWGSGQTLKALIKNYGIQRITPDHKEPT